jgi:hypothetical protein
MCAPNRTITTCTALLHPRPPCPSLFTRASHSDLIMRFLLLSLGPPPLILSYVSHPPRSSAAERQTFPKHHKPQCRSCVFQGHNDRSHGTPFPSLMSGSHHPYPQLYLARPNLGKVDPGQTVEVQGAIYLLVFNSVD